MMLMNAGRNVFSEEAEPNRTYGEVGYSYPEETEEGKANPQKKSILKKKNVGRPPPASRSAPPASRSAQRPDSSSTDPHGLVTYPMSHIGKNYEKYLKHMGIKSDNAKGDIDSFKIPKVTRSDKDRSSRSSAVSFRIKQAEQNIKLQNKTESFEFLKSAYEDDEEEDDFSENRKRPQKKEDRDSSRRRSSEDIFKKPRDPSQDPELEKLKKYEPEKFEQISALIAQKELIEKQLKQISSSDDDIGLSDIRSSRDKYDSGGSRRKRSYDDKVDERSETRSRSREKGSSSSRDRRSDAKFSRSDFGFVRSSDEGEKERNYFDRPDKFKKHATESMSVKASSDSTLQQNFPNYASHGQALLPTPGLSDDQSFPGSDSNSHSYQFGNKAIPPGQGLLPTPVSADQSFPGTSDFNQHFGNVSTQGRGLLPVPRPHNETGSGFPPSNLPSTLPGFDFQGNFKDPAPVRKGLLPTPDNKSDLPGKVEPFEAIKKTLNLLNIKLTESKNAGSLEKKMPPNIQHQEESPIPDLRVDPEFLYGIKKSMSSARSQIETMEQFSQENAEPFQKNVGLVERVLPPELRKEQHDLSMDQRGRGRERWRGSGQSEDLDMWNSSYDRPSDSQYGVKDQEILDRHYTDPYANDSEPYDPYKQDSTQDYGKEPFDQKYSQGSLQDYNAEHFDRVDQAYYQHSEPHYESESYDPYNHTSGEFENYENVPDPGRLTIDRARDSNVRKVPPKPRPQQEQPPSLFSLNVKPTYIMSRKIMETVTSVETDPTPQDAAINIPPVPQNSNTDNEIEYNAYPEEQPGYGDYSYPADNTEPPLQENKYQDEHFLHAQRGIRRPAFEGGDLAYPEEYPVGDPHLDPHSYDVQEGEYIDSNVDIYSQDPNYPGYREESQEDLQYPPVPPSRRSRFGPENPSHTEADIEQYPEPGRPPQFADRARPPGIPHPGRPHGIPRPPRPRGILPTPRLHDIPHRAMSQEYPETGDQFTEWNEKGDYEMAEYPTEYQEGYQEMDAAYGNTEQTADYPQTESDSSYLLNVQGAIHEITDMYDDNIPLGLDNTSVRPSLLPTPPLPRKNNRPDDPVPFDDHPGLSRRPILSGPPRDHNQPSLPMGRGHKYHGPPVGQEHPGHPITQQRPGLSRDQKHPGPPTSQNRPGSAGQNRSGPPTRRPPQRPASGHQENKEEQLHSPANRGKRPGGPADKKDGIPPTKQKKSGCINCGSLDHLKCPKARKTEELDHPKYGEQHGLPTHKITSDNKLEAVKPATNNSVKVEGGKEVGGQRSLVGSQGRPKMGIAKCSYCQILGHIFKECPNKVCTICSGTDHVTKECEDKRKHIVPQFIAKRKLELYQKYLQQQMPIKDPLNAFGETSRDLIMPYDYNLAVVKTNGTVSIVTGALTLRFGVFLAREYSTDRSELKRKLFKRALDNMLSKPSNELVEQKDKGPYGYPISDDLLNQLKGGHLESKITSTAKQTPIKHTAAKEAPSLTKQMAPATKQTTPTTKQTPLASKQTPPATKQTSATRQTTPITKQTPPVAKQTSSATKQTPPATKQTPSGTKQTSTDIVSKASSPGMSDSEFEKLIHKEKGISVHTIIAALKAREKYKKEHKLSPPLDKILSNPKTQSNAKDLILHPGSGMKDLKKLVFHELQYYEKQRKSQAFTILSYSAARCGMLLQWEQKCVYTQKPQIFRCSMWLEKQLLGEGYSTRYEDSKKIAAINILSQMYPRHQVLVMKRTREYVSRMTVKYQDISSKVDILMMATGEQKPDVPPKVNDWVIQICKEHIMEFKDTESIDVLEFTPGCTDDEIGLIRSFSIALGFHCFKREDSIFCVSRLTVPDTTVRSVQKIGKSNDKFRILDGGERQSIADSLRMENQLTVDR